MEAKTLYHALASCLIAAAALTASAADTNYMDVEWNYTTKAPLDYVWAGELNGDGFKEVAAASSYTDLKGNSVGWVYLLDKNGNCIWKDSNNDPKCFKETPGAVSALTVDDLDGNGKKEIIAGVQSSVHFFDETGELSTIWLSDQTLKVQKIIVDDIDGDGKNELIVGAGSLTKGRILVYKSDKSTRWYKDTPKGSVTSVYVADLNGDGQKEVVVGEVTKSGGEHLAGFIYVYDSKGAPLWNFQTDKGVQTVYAEDLDGDGQKEVLAGAQEKFYSISSKGELKGSLVTGTEIGVQIPIRNIMVVNLFQNDSKSVILGADDIYAVNKDYGTRWRNKAGVETYDLAYADINNDGVAEIIAATESLFFIDENGNETGRFYLSTPMFSMHSLYITDLNDDGFLEVLAGGVDGKIYVLRSKISEKKLGASQLYLKAMNLNVAGNYAEARKNAQSARQIYEDMGNTQGVKSNIKQIDDLLKQISATENKTANESRTAERYYNESYTAYITGDYLNAYTSAQRAKSIYASMPNNSMDVKRCNDIIDPSTEALRSDAENAYKNATELYASQDYSNASVAISRAVKEYETIRDSDGTERSRALEERISEKTGGPITAITENKSDYMQQITGAFAILAQGSDIITPALYILVAAALAVIAFILIKRITKKKTKWEMGNRREQIGRRRAMHVAENAMDEMEKDDNEEPTLKNRTRQAQKEIHLVPEPATEEKPQKLASQHHKAAEKHAEPLPQKHRQIEVADRKPIPKVTKDTFRAEGVSLRCMSCTEDAEDLQD